MAEISEKDIAAHADEVIATLGEIGQELHDLMIDVDPDRSAKLAAVARNLGRIADDTEPGLRSRLESQQ